MRPHLKRKIAAESSEERIPSRGSSQHSDLRPEQPWNIQRTEDW